MEKGYFRNLGNSMICVGSALIYALYTIRCESHIDKLNQYTGETDVKSIEWLYRYHSWRADTLADKSTVWRNRTKRFLKANI